jgi:hypothetical protein
VAIEKAAEGSDKAELQAALADIEAESPAKRVAA